MPWSAKSFASRHNKKLHGEAASKAAAQANAMIKLRPEGDYAAKTPGVRGALWENRTLVLAVVGLVIVIGLHFRESAAEPTPTISGYTEAQYDAAIAKAKEATAKPLQDKLDQADNDNTALRQSIPKQIAEAVAKAAAQSDIPVSVDKLPTSLRLFFKIDKVETIEAKNAVPAGLIGWRQSRALLGSSSPGWTIIMIFKKPIMYKEICFDGHETGISTPVSPTKDSHYAIAEFEAGALYGLADLYAANECKK